MKADFFILWCNLHSISWACKHLGRVTWWYIRDAARGRAEGAAAPPDFGRSVNPISTRGGWLCPPQYYLPPRIFDPCCIPEDWVNELVNLIERLGLSSSVRRIMHAFVLRSCWSLAKINARMWHLRPYTINIQWRLTSWAFIVVVKSMLRCHWALVKILALIFSWASQRALVRSLKQSLDWL